MSLDDFAKGFGRIWTIIAYCLGYPRVHLMPFNMKVKRFKEKSS
jgi:hypothetical protein